jgi:hypothetical protein
MSDRQLSSERLLERVESVATRPSSSSYASATVLCGGAFVIIMLDTFTNVGHVDVHFVLCSCNAKRKVVLQKYRQRFTVRRIQWR